MTSKAAAERAERLSRAAKQELAEGALELFADVGYHATRVADITARVGVGQSTFYKHFASKREVIDHLIDTRLAAILTTVSSDNAATAADTLEDYVGQARSIAAGLFAGLANDLPTLRVLVFEAASIDKELQDRWQGILTGARQVVAEYYANGVRKGYFRADLDTGSAADAVVGLLLGGLVRMLSEPSEDEQHRYTETVIDMILAHATAPGPPTDDGAS